MRIAKVVSVLFGKNFRDSFEIMAKSSTGGILKVLVGIIC